MFIKKNLFKIENCRKRDINEAISYLRIIDKKYSIYYKISMHPYNEALKKLKNKDEDLINDLIVSYIMKNHSIEITDTEMLYYWMIEYRAKIYIQNLKCEKINDIPLPIILSEYFNIEFSRLGKILKGGFTTFQKKHGEHPFLYNDKNKVTFIKSVMKKLKIIVNR
jgi:hypothetical protein